ncbi:helix-turn-helix transcriptional regulator [bacterium]|nr:helix-turn-helix transcriptional regulator [bacterium]
MTGLQQKLGARIKELRKNKGYTQEILAEKLDIGVRSLRKIESGGGMPSGNTLEKLTCVLDVTASELFDFEHLQTSSDLKELVFNMINSNPDKITDIYKIVRAIVM